LVCSVLLIFNCTAKNTISHDNKIVEMANIQAQNKVWENSELQNAGLVGKWLHPCGDRILEITDTKIMEHFFNGDKTVLKEYRTESENLFFSSGDFTFRLPQNDILVLCATDDSTIQMFNILEDDIGELPSARFYSGIYHRINNTGITALNKGRYDFSYSFGKWSYRGNDGMQAPSYWLRAHYDINSLDSLEFIDDKKLLIRRITFVEENRNENPWGGFVSTVKPEEYEYEISGSDLIIKLNENLLKLKIINEKTIFYEIEKSIFIYDLD